MIILVYLTDDNRSAALSCPFDRYMPALLILHKYFWQANGALYSSVKGWPKWCFKNNILLGFTKAGLHKSNMKDKI